MQQDRPSARQQITYLVTILGAGLVAGLALIGYLAYTYGPTGQYKAENVLLDPALIRNLSFSDTDHGRGKDSLYRLEGIRFQYFDEKSGQWRTYPLTDTQYDNIYTLLKRDESIQFPTQETIDLYSTGRPSTLEFVVKPQLPNSSNQEKVFISADFIPHSDNYRVKLRASEGWQQYAYFNHENVYEHVTTIIFGGNK